MSKDEKIKELTIQKEQTKYLKEYMKPLLSPKANEVLDELICSYDLEIEEVQEGELEDDE